jgi:hypothetical protein
LPSPLKCQLSRTMQTLKNNLVNSMNLLLKCACGFEQQYARSIVKMAFKVSSASADSPGRKNKLFSNACII